ncbi:hypothetical protein CCP3SC1AL1_1460006 [Gammaproteobacteria bacterium]
MGFIFFEEMNPEKIGIGKKMDLLLGIGWQISELHGWGVFGINVVRSLLKRGGPPFRLLDQPVLDEVASKELFQYVQDWNYLNRRLAKESPSQPMFLQDTVIIYGFGSDFTEPGSHARFQGLHNVGFIFFEEMNPEKIGIGKKMDHLLAGSSWNTQVLKKLGFPKVSFVMQGVDTERFQPRSKQKRFGDRFVIFSGGKLEFRKAQDIVLVAFREFHKRHPEALLVTAWHNPWPAMSVAGVLRSPHMLGAPKINSAGQFDISEWLLRNGLPRDSFLDTGFINNREFPEWYREVDVAVFPNRAEGGTNLVAMEIMASGVPCILSANTGHLDLTDESRTYPLFNQKPLSQDWGESDPKEVVDRLEEVYQNRQEARVRGMEGARFIQQASWEAQTEKLLEAIFTGL